MILQTGSATGTPIDVYSDVENGVESHIYVYHDGRFTVKVLDTDAGLYLPDPRIFRTMESARNFARLCVGRN